MFNNQSLIKNSFFSKVNPSFKFICFILLVLIIFIPGGFLNQIILFGILVSMAILSKFSKKTIINILKTYIIMFVLFTLINWITIKMPLSIYVDNNLSVIGTFPNSNHFIGYDNNTFIGTIYGGSIQGIIPDHIIQYYKTNHLSEINNWCDKLNRNDFDYLLNNFNSYATEDDFKTVLYLINNGDFVYNGIKYKVEIIRNNPFTYHSIVYDLKGAVMYNSNWYTITPYTFINSIFIANKVIFVIISSTVLMSTTTSSELTNGLEKLLSPLKIFRFPVSQCALILSIGIRFIPSLITESKRILNAQAARGLDFYNGNLLIKIKALISLIVPLFSISISKSNDLASSMEARGYNPDASRTIYRVLTYSWRDFIYFGIIVFITALFITMWVTNFIIAGFGILNLGLII